MKTSHKFSIIAAVLILIVGIFILSSSGSDRVQTDKLTGTWYAGGTNIEGFDWWMQYDFLNNTYILTTGTDYAEEGTYRITERFLDGSMFVEKTFSEGKKVHEMTVVVPQDDESYIIIEGLQLDRVE